jgi:predicted TIM-barrel fold metal-dependent hydrolase
MATSHIAWIDTHIHISDLGPDGQPREGVLEALLNQLDRADADLRFVVSCDVPYARAMKDDPSLINRANRMVYDFVRQAPGRLFGSCMVNPRFLTESLKTMEHCFEKWGFVQFGEMLQYMHGYELEGAESIETIRRAAAYGVPVQVHLGTYWHKDYRGGVDGMDQMRGLLRVAARVPEARYVLAHAIGCGPTKEWVPWADWYLDCLNAYFATYPRNFWIEIRDFQAPALARILREVPGDRILAGTDWTTRLGPPFPAYGTMFGLSEAENPFPPAVSSMIGFLRKAGAAESLIEQIAFRNAQELLKV